MTLKQIYEEARRGSKREHSKRYLYEKLKNKIYNLGLTPRESKDAIITVCNLMKY